MKSRLICCSLISLCLFGPETSAQWTQVSGGLTNQHIYAMAVSRSKAGGATIFAGTSGGGVFLSTDSGASWNSVGSANLDVVALTVSGTHIYAGTNGSGIFVSTDNGAQWNPARVSLPDTHIFGFAAARMRDGGSHVFAGTYGNGVFLSTDHGSSWWAAVNNDGVFPEEVWCLAFRGKNLYAGTRTSTYVSGDNGATWRVIGRVNDVHAFVVAPGDARGQLLFAGCLDNTGVWRSDNENSAWTKVSSGITNKYVWSLATAADRMRRTSIFAGTEGGIFRTTNGGKRWIPFNRGLTNKIIRSIAVSGEYIFVGTWGDGVWRRPLSDLRTAEP